MNTLVENSTENEICPHCGYDQSSPYKPSYLAPGTLLNDNYLIGKVLTIDGEGATYIGYDIIMKDKVMIKEYMPDAFCTRQKNNPVVEVNPSFVAQFKTYMSEFVDLNRKLSKMRTIDHVASVKDMFGNNNTGYVVYGYFDGITLLQYLEEKSGFLSFDEVRAIIPAICTVLSIAHNSGLIHRGISPENILINQKREVNLIGFSVQDLRTANTDLASELYSGYAAPEQYSSSGFQGTWTDVYGTAALIYKLLTGVTPTDAITRLNNDNLVSPSEINADIPKNASNVIMRALSVDANSRIQTMSQFAAMLFETADYSRKLSVGDEATQVLPIQRIARMREVEASNNQKDNSTYEPQKSSGFKWIAIFLSGFILIFSIMYLLMYFGSKEEADMPIQFTTFSSTQAETTPPPQTMASSVTAVTKMESDAGSGMLYVMNNLVGKNYDIIENAATYDNLVFIPKYEYSDDEALSEKGIILSQSITVGESYVFGDEIEVTVSLGPSVTTIPEFLSLNGKEYFTLLDSYGIKYVEEKIITNDVMGGYVVELSKEAGELISVEKGEILTVYVAQNDESFNVTDIHASTEFEMEEEVIISVYD